MRVLMARTSVSKASTRPASRAICQPLNSAPAAANADVTAVKTASPSMHAIVADGSPGPGAALPESGAASLHRSARWPLAFEGAARRAQVQATRPLWAWVFG